MNIPEPVKDQVRRRSGNKCEWPECTKTDFRGLQFAHILHRGMGGRNGDAAKIINDARNLLHLCCFHHDVLDMRVWEPELRKQMLRFFKAVMGWLDWAKEAKRKGLKIGRAE